MEREKIIEEIRNYIKENAEMGWVNADEVLRKINNVIPDGAVVLTREEYAKFKKNVRENEFYALYNEIDQARKETEDAVNKRTISIIKDLIGHRFAYYVKDETYGTVTCCADYVVYNDDVKFLEKKYKVEVE